MLTRYGIDTHDVGSDTAYFESAIETIATEKARLDELARSQEATRKAAAEHEKAMQLLAAEAEELRIQAATLAPETERHQIPVEYLANPELAQALQRAHGIRPVCRSTTSRRDRPNRDGRRRDARQLNTLDLS